MCQLLKRATLVFCVAFFSLVSLAQDRGPVRGADAVPSEQCRDGAIKLVNYKDATNQGIPQCCNASNVWVSCAQKFLSGSATGDLAYSDGSDGSASEAAFNYNAATNTLTVDSIDGSASGPLNIEGSNKGSSCDAPGAGNSSFCFVGNRLSYRENVLNGDVTYEVGYPEVRSYTWQAQDISTDNTECTVAAEVTINSGPRVYAIACPMGTADTNGAIYGSLVMPDGWDGLTVTLELTTYMTTDAAGGTFYTEAFAMCRTDDEAINSTWGTGITIDIVSVTGDSVNDILTQASTGITGNSCAAGESLFWKIEICDDDATPAGGCTDANGLENDFDILSVKMEYTVISGD